jgi:5-methylcytosine-specific restriction endonuclease McrA
MTRTYIPANVRRRVAETARHRCGYCQTQQIIVGIPLHVEHIIPLAAGGDSDENNLLNQPFTRRARRRWVKAGWHPPAD